MARLLLDAKVPRENRPRVPLVVKDGEVLWVAGFRRADTAPVKNDCNAVLSIEHIPPEGPDRADDAISLDGRHAS